MTCGRVNIFEALQLIQRQYKSEIKLSDTKAQTKAANTRYSLEKNVSEVEQAPLKHYIVMERLNNF